MRLDRRFLLFGGWGRRWLHARPAPVKGQGIERVSKSTNVYQCRLFLDFFSFSVTGCLVGCS